MARPACWDRIEEIHADYLAGMSCASLERKYGIGDDAIGRKAKALGWVEEREKARKAAAEKSAQAFASHCAELAEKAVDITDAILDRIMLGVVSGAYMATAQDVRNITSALKDVREMRGEYSPLAKDRLEAQIAQLRAQTKGLEREVEDGGKTVRLEIADGLAEFSE